MSHPNYVFFPKASFTLRANLLAALVIYMPAQAPALFLIPALAWEHPNALLADRHYQGKQSPPEWGLNLSRKNLPLLEPFRFATTVQALELTP